MRHTALIVGIMTSVGVHAALLLTSAEPRAPFEPEQASYVEIGLVRQLTDELAVARKSTAARPKNKHKAEASTPNNRVEKRAIAPASDNKSPSAPVVDTEEKGLPATLMAQDPPPLPDPTQPVNTLDAAETSPHHASNMPSAALAPVFSYNPPPAYPARALRLGWEGKVLLKVMISYEGDVDEVSIAQTSGFDLLDQAALESVRTWRFVPPTADNQPAGQAAVIPVHFKIRRD